MSRETQARAANSQDLGMEPGVVHDVDRIAAAAGGDTLGGLLLRYREAAQDQWGKRIVLILARRIGDKFNLPRPISIRIAAAALIEYHNPHCEACHGARVMVLDNLKIECGTCHGTGKQHYTDVHRRAAIGTYGTRIDSAMADCHKDMANAVGAFLGHANARLG